MGFISKEHFRVASRQISSYFKGKAQTACVDGEEWKYLSIGKHGGESILFLHGLGSNKSLWRSQLVGYSDERYYRVALDVPGASLIQYFDNKPHTLQALARWLDQMIDTLNLGKVHLTAHSTMTLVATFYAATRPEKVTSLTLMGIPDIWDTSAKQPGGVIDRFRKEVQFESLEDSIKQFESMFYDPPRLPKSLQRYAYQQHLKYIGRFLSVMEEFLASLPLILAHTRKVKCPTLIINGDHDTYSSEAFVNSLDRHFNNPTVIQLKNAGHALMLEKPREVVSLHNDFIRYGRIRGDTWEHVGIANR